MTDPLQPEDPAQVGEYILTGRLGDGGQGSVYLAHDGTGRRVAVKLLHARLSGDEAARARFVRELEVARRVGGFCTAQVLDADVEGDRPYIVSEFVDGPSLTALVRAEGPRSPAELVRLAVGTATALVAVHRAGIVHRDFKPPNVLVGPGGPRVIDFGIARALDSTVLTMTSQVVGTPAYMAPEQVSGGVVGPAADMFAWAATMLFAATGAVPFGGESIAAVLHRVLHDTPDVAPLPPGLREIVAACLEKDPDRRPTSEQVLFRLLDVVGEDGGGDAVRRGAELVKTGGARPGWPSGVDRVRTGRSRRILVAGAVPAALAALAILVPVVVSQFPDGGARGSGGAGTSAGGSPVTVPVGYLGPLTGDVASLGRAMADGARLAVDEHNARHPAVRARLVEADTRGVPDSAPAAVQQLRKAGAVAVVGPSLSAETKAAMPILELAHIPSVSPAAAAGPLAESGWRFWHTTVPDGEEAARALADLAGGSRRPLALYDGTTSARDVANVVKQRLESKGATVRQEQIAELPGEDAGIVRKMRGWGTDAVFLSATADRAASLIHEARAGGVKARFYLSDLALAKGVATPDAEGTMLTCSCLSPEAAQSLPPAMAAFSSRFAGANKGRRPPIYAAESYDAASVLLKALAQGRRTGDEINAFLRTVDVEDGLTQRIRFTGTGRLTEGRSYAYRVQAGKIVLLGEAQKPRTP
ncbi:bifunctional serine/threonine-protein kinase/ABC transporter substrate-binding protein [Actinomadura roseirufa]|uniref:bifunctional serine/threonine-protein kinase/ABC transporter substrate-binding protein n=1 Tax=Actinomadura roseirufa TaxID=2094049 RepID=UPI0013F14EC9|nr:bifunctional serine/threonine-protein kinase/ABC transporter substrate-binding protein [Actinomadura roseirufa]